YFRTLWSVRGEAASHLADGRAGLSYSACRGGAEIEDWLTHDDGSQVPLSGGFDFHVQGSARRRRMCGICSLNTTLSRTGLGAILSLILLLASNAGIAWGATGAVGGSATPLPDNTHPNLGDVYLVDLFLQNGASATSSPPGFGRGIAVNVNSARIYLACTASGCAAGTGIPGAVAFAPTTGNQCELTSSPASGSQPRPACVGSCTAGFDATVNSNFVDITTAGCSLSPNQNEIIATIRVQPQALVGHFFLSGVANYQD